MITTVYRKEKFAVEPVQYLPSISIVMPFEPRIESKSTIEKRLKSALETVETEFGHSFPTYISKPAINKLRSILSTLDYTTNKKGLAIFISPFIEKVYYLNMTVAEKVVVGQTFDVRDIVANKKADKRYLVLALSDHSASVYTGNGSQLTCIVKNKIRQKVTAPVSEMAAVSTVLVEDASDDQKKLINEVNKSLPFILKAFKLPLFVIGNKKNITRFSTTSRYTGQVLKFIECADSRICAEGVKLALQPFLSNWKQTRLKYIFQQLEQSMSAGKLYIGIDEVWNAAKERKCNLLVVEKDYTFPACLDENAGGTSAAPIVDDAVENTIELVLAGGGAVEFVETGMLKEYRHIALF